MPQPPSNFHLSSPVIYRKACFQQYLPVLLQAIIGLIVFFLTRLALFVKCSSLATSTPLALLATFSTGFLFDAIVLCYMMVPLFLYLTILPVPPSSSRVQKIILLTFICLYNFLFLFNAIAEYVFWDEFGCRYNFIAVDYLAYTTEVLGNIWQSYPIVWIMLGILLCATGLTCFFHFIQRRFSLYSPYSSCSLKQRLIISGTFFLVFISSLLVNHSCHPDFDGNHFNQELAANGIYSLAIAFRQNQLDYMNFYPILNEADIAKELREELTRDGGSFLTDSPLDIRRTILPPAPEKRLNVILILEESMSAEFSSRFSGNSRNLMPCLDKLAESSLILERCFASGTRTVRGIEAVQLSLPPTPGQSIVKRPNHENLFSMGKIFAEHGYDNTFLYGGNGYFDNMNAFFQANHYTIQDCTSKYSQPKTFDTIWGYCDEDVFQWALDAGDRATAAGKPFHQFILSTSNHRPYTFPEGRIDAPQKHRSSAVKYSDFALGEFIRKAKQKPWFDNTLFVIVADHCHSTSGRETLALNKYHIPALFYSPKHIQPLAINTVCSQIDIAPTIFGLMNWNYVSEFYGQDIRRLSPQDGRAFPGTFQNLGFFHGATGLLTTLSPVRKIETTQWSLTLPFASTENVQLSEEDLKCSIAIYQSAYLRLVNRSNQTTPERKFQP